MNKKPVFYDASNPCVLKILNAIHRIRQCLELVGFVDGTPEKQGKTFYGHPVHGRKNIPETHDQMHINRKLQF